MSQLEAKMVADLFHGFIAVAPLKPYFGWKNRAAALALPRLHRRGPIEACPGVLAFRYRPCSSTASSPWPH